jgi:hypothetical protein
VSVAPGSPADPSRLGLFQHGAATLALPDDIDMTAFGRPELRVLPTLRLIPGVRSHLDRQFAGPPGYRPLLLDLHVPGDHDRRIGLDQSRRLHRTLLAADVPAELLVLPGADHGTSHFDRPGVHEATLGFLRDALDERAPRPAQPDGT